MKTKKTLLLIAFLLFASMVTFAQNVEERSVASFNKIEAGEAIEVFLTQGDKEIVKVEAEGVAPEKIITEVSGETLKIHMENGNYNNRTVTVYVTFKALEEISCNSAAKIKGKSTINGDELEINVNSAGKVELDVDVKSLEISLSSSGDLLLTGTAEYQETDISSAGKLEAFDLDCRNTKIAVSSGGNAKVTANNELNARANSGGNIRYKGNPDQKNTNTNSGGSISKAK